MRKTLRPSLSHKHLVCALAWCTSRCGGMINSLLVMPPTDNDDEIAGVLRLMPEKEPLIQADQIRIRVNNRVVGRTSLVSNREERETTELDAAYVFGVDKIVNFIDVCH